MRLKELLHTRFNELNIQINVESVGLVKAELGNELYFDVDSDVADQFECQAGMLAWWDTLRMEVEKELTAVELDYDAWYSAFYDTEFSRIWAITNYTKSTKPTNTQVEIAIKARRREEYFDWQRRLNEKREKVELLKSIVKWYQEKGMMLVQVVKVMAKDS